MTLGGLYIFDNGGMGQGFGGVLDPEYHLTASVKKKAVLALSR